MKKAIKKLKYAEGGVVEAVAATDAFLAGDSVSAALTGDPNKPAKPTTPAPVSEEQWLMLKKKYTEGLPEVKPYGASAKGSALDKRMKWMTWANQKLPTSGTPAELSARAAKQAGIDPGMLLASSLEEGVGLRFMGQGNDYSNAYIAANEKGELKDYPVDAFRNYGLDQVAGRIDDFIKKGWVPADIKNKMKSFNASNELDEKEYYQKAYNAIKGYEGLGNFKYSSDRGTYDKIDKILDEYDIEGVPEMKASAQTAAFKDDESAYYAKAAFLRSEQENVVNYAKQKGYKLTPEEQQFFTMSSYNGGFGNARQMLDYYGGKKELGNNAFYKDRGNKGQIYDNIMPRFAGARLFTGEGYFEYGGKVPKKPYTNGGLITGDPIKGKKGKDKPKGKVDEGFVMPIPVSGGDQGFVFPDGSIAKIDSGFPMPTEDGNGFILPNGETVIGRGRIGLAPPMPPMGTVDEGFVMPIIANTKLRGVKEYKKGGKVPKYLDGGPVDPFTPTGVLSGGNNWTSPSNEPVPINPDGTPAIRLQQQAGTPVNPANVVPLSQFYDVVNGPNGNQIMQGTGQYVDAQGQTTTPGEQQMTADQVSAQNRNAAMKREGVKNDAEMIATTSMAAINAFFQRNNAAQADRSNRRTAIQQTMLAQMSPYLEGTGSQAIMENGGKITGGDIGIKTIGGGGSKLISSSDHSNPMVKFSGRTHDEGGIGLEYGGSVAEVEDKEVGWIDREGSLNIFGKLKLPGTNQTFRKAADNIASEEDKIDGQKSKYLNILNHSNPANKYQESALSTSKVMFKSLDKQSKQIAEKKEALASYQNLILDMVEQGEKMKYGGQLPVMPSVPKFATGGKLEDEFTGDPTPENIKKIAQAIGQFESSAKYDAIGVPVTKGQYKGQRALGKYQIMSDNMRSWGKAATGRDITVAEFIGDPKLQDQIAEYQMSQIAKTNPNPQDIASIWFTGRPVGKASGLATDDLGTSGNQYVEAVMKIYNGGGGATNTPVSSTTAKTTPKITTANIMADYKPINNPVPGNEQPVVETKYGAAKRDATPFSDKALITSGTRERGYQSPLDVEQIAPELISIATNQRQAVPGFTYQPDLQQTFDISYQLGRNENESTFRQASALAEQTGNMDVLAQLAAQKYKADQQYNMQEVQGNAQQRLQTYAQNIATMNDAKVKNLALAADQQAKQAQADFNTRAQDMAAIKSISGKVEQNKLENKTYNAYANLFQNYGFDSKGNVTFDPGKVSKKFNAGEAQAFGMMAAQQGASAIMNGDFSRQFTKVKNSDGSQTTTETLGTNKKIQEEYNALKKQGFDDGLIGNMLRAKYPETISGN